MPKELRGAAMAPQRSSQTQTSAVPSDSGGSRSDRKRLGLRILAGAIPFAAVMLTAGPALADCHGDGDDGGDGTATIGVSGSEQIGKWRLNQERVRVKATTGSGMNTDNCHDAAVDWMTTSGHYDNRIARNCRPGTLAESNSGGDGWWGEPSNWGGRTVTGLQKGAGLVYVEATESYKNSEYFSASEPNCPFGDGSPFTAQSPVTFVKFIWRTGSGALYYNGGGDVASASS